MTVEKSGEKFSGYNKPKRTPNHPKKSHAVLAKEGDKVKLVRFGQQGVRGAGKTQSQLKIKRGSVATTLVITHRANLLQSCLPNTGHTKLSGEI